LGGAVYHFTMMERAPTPEAAEHGGPVPRGEEAGAEERGVLRPPERRYREPMRRTMPRWRGRRTGRDTGQGTDREGGPAPGPAVPRAVSARRAPAGGARRRGRGCPPPAARSGGVRGPPVR